MQRSRLGPFSGARSRAAEGARGAGRIETEEEKGILRSLSLFFDELFRTCPASRRRTRPDDSPLPFLVIGHRGSPVEQPENTIPSCRLALDEGANALEIDLCITSDGLPVLWHDHDPDDFVVKLRHAGLEPAVGYTTVFAEEGPYRRPIHELTLEQFREHCGYRPKDGEDRIDVRIPTFSEFIDWLLESGSPIDALFLDVKIPANRLVDIEPFTTSIFDDLARLPEKIPVVFETTSPAVQDALKESTPSELPRRIIHALDTEVNPGLILWPRLYSAVAHAIGRGNSMAIPLRPRPITIAPWVTYRRLISGDVTRMRRHNRRHPDKPVLGIIGATINDPEEMSCLIGLGISGMQTDRPKLLAERLRMEEG